MLPSRVFFDNFFDDYTPSKKLENMMKCDISEDENGYMIEIDMPGFKKENINMELADGYLTISAESNSKEEENNKKYIRRERKQYESCSRQFYVGEVNDEEIKAEFKDGILVVSVPKVKKVETKKIINID